MSLLDKMMGAWKVKNTVNVEEDLKGIKDKLKAVLYDDELVETLAPVFAKLQAQEGFDKVWEVIETKESQIEALSKEGFWSQSTDTSNLGGNEEEESDVDAVDALINQRYNNGE